MNGFAAGDDLCGILCRVRGRAIPRTAHVADGRWECLPDDCACCPAGDFRFGFASQ